MRVAILAIALALAPVVSSQAQEAPRIFYPAAAQAQGIGGRAVVECLVGEDGRLACEVVEESPANMGFGAAALRMSQDWRVAPAAADGTPTVGGKIRRTLAFEPGPPPRVIQDPSTVTGIRWEAMPDARDFARHYPDRARSRGINAAVTINCIVNEEHGLDCEVTAEDPLGMGFGDATLQIAREFRIAPLTEGGEPTVGGRIRRTIRWVAG